MDKILVALVDDELTVRQAIAKSLESLGVDVRTFGSASDFLADMTAQNYSLLITDVNMPDMTGLQLLKVIKKARPMLRVLLISGYGDVPMAVEALKVGASDFIEKPLDEQTFLPKVSALLEIIEKEKNLPLTPAEIEVVTHIVRGKTNKEIAHILGKSIRTVENHRFRISKKLNANSTAELVKIALQMGLGEHA